MMKYYLPKIVQLFENIEGDSLENLSLQEYNTDPFKGDHGYILSGIFSKIWLEGYDYFIYKIAKPLSIEGNIKLNHVVHEVNYAKNHGMQPCYLWYSLGENKSGRFCRSLLCCNSSSRMSESASSISSKICYTYSSFIHLFLKRKWIALKALK